MKILEDLFLPTYFVNHFSDITPEVLKEKGYKAVMIDLDNTLVAYDEANSNEVVNTWFNALDESEIKIMIVSNGKYDRVSAFSEPEEFIYIDSARKPFSKGFTKAMRAFGVYPHETLMIGDQVMTDVLGSRRVGVDSALVRPIKDKDALATKLNRFIESLILKQFNRKGLVNWRETIE
ncbi:YqeG family HAD IIIA-type phosphatase [Aliicoccus persicus]|uniref:YqeG family HAD IIIA-type phosphatase n=1 Tax=Aliicoccus persicus TaxID=930138 RepID=A0A662Z2Q4_9STAP|nr:YqeG family HAD IIIA-type phosphatase [Aliicoccus persicus]SEV85439.1 hypothetical protein SAMN05192557_0503 [Aliicoccus persicus]HJE18953.1 YqeG family HAD IIIA-type phosphatase [Aliicoccus persicus]